LIKHVIFDFDGTLADSMELGLQVYNDIAEKYHCKEMTMDELRSLNHMPIKERIKHAGIPSYRIPQMLVEGLLKFRQLIGSIHVFEGIPELLENLKKEGLGLSIISSNSFENINDFLQKNCLNVFDSVISVSNLFGKDKSIRRYVKKLDVAVDEVIYVGDEIRDIEACKKVPVQSISVTWGYDSLDLLKKGSPDFIVSKPDEILEIILRLNSI